MSVVHPQTALESLTKAQITELRSFNNPPVNVKMVLSAVMVCLGQLGTWKVAKLLLNSPNQFFDTLYNYDCDNIHPNLYQKLKKIVSQQTFDPQTIHKNSPASASLAKWVILLVKYYEYKQNNLDKQESKEDGQFQFLNEEVFNPMSNQNQRETIKKNDKINHKDQEVQDFYQEEVPQKEPLVDKRNEEPENFELDQLPDYLRPVVRRIIKNQLKKRLEEEMEIMKHQIGEQYKWMKVDNSDQIKEMLEVEKQNQNRVNPFYHGGYHGGVHPYAGYGYAHDPNFYHPNQDFNNLSTLSYTRYPSPAGKARRFQDTSRISSKI